MIRKFNINWDHIGVNAQISAFTPDGADSLQGVQEMHVMLHVAPNGEMFVQQYDRICQAQQLLMQHPDFTGAVIIAKRYFLSDSTNQQPLMEETDGCAVSCIQQPPLDGSKVALWMYITRTPASHPESPYSHIWTMGMTDSCGDSAQQTTSLLTHYSDMLRSAGATLADNCIRTWFFVRDVDTQYSGMVRARREFFADQGLTHDTHYISSTGIGGNPADTHSLVQFDALAITGLQPSQQRYLYARTHLNSTYEYGVTFERGTLVEYGDRGHIFISGTASIDNQGKVLHTGDIVSQTHRMWENVQTLLREGGMDFSNVVQLIVYLRDTADYDTVRRMFDEQFPDTPTVITLAPVCRPTWLIEMECMAIDGRHTSFPVL